MQEVIRLFYKEIRALFMDKGIMVLMLGGPLFYSFFYPLPYSQATVRDIPVAVIDMDDTPNSRTLIRMFDATEEITVKQHTDLVSARKALSARQVYGIIYIDNDFQKNILKGKAQQVKIYTDGSYLIYYKQVSSAAQRVIKTMSASIEIKKLQAKGAGRYSPYMRSPVKLITKNLHNPSGGYTEYVVPAVFLVIIHQILLIGIGMRAGTLRESKKKYKKNTKVWHIFASKVLTFLFFGLVYFVYLFVVMYRVFGFTGGDNILAMMLYLTPFMFAVIFLGIFLSGFFKERETSMLLIIVSSMAVLFSSGAVWPRYLMPKVIQILSVFIPNTLGIDGVIRLYIMNAPFSAMAFEFAGLCILALIYGILGYRVVKKRYPHKI